MSNGKTVNYLLQTFSKEMGINKVINYHFRVYRHIQNNVFEQGEKSQTHINNVSTSFGTISFVERIICSRKTRQFGKKIIIIS